VLRAMRENPRLRHVLQGADREVAAGEALGIVRSSGALAATRQEIACWCDKAVSALSAADEDLGPTGLAMLTKLASTLVQPWSTPASPHPPAAARPGSQTVG
jgi:hypothetical protein